MLLAGTSEFMLFSLIAMRMAGFIFLNPLLGRRNIPALAKTGMALALAVVIFPVSVGVKIDVSSPLVYGVLLLKEFVLGYLLGFVMQLFEMVVTYAGAVMDFQMGLSMATVYDVQNGVQIALTGSLMQIFYILLFFAVDGHLALMKIIVTSGQVVPYGGLWLSASAGQAVLKIFIECIVLAVKLAFPIIAFEFLMEIGVGILMKIIPQINLFILSIQLKVLIGIVMLVFLAFPISDYMGDVITSMMKAMQEILRTAGG